MTVLIILILLIIFWPYIWRWLRPYVIRWMQHKTEDYVRRSMGMPPRDKKRSNESSETGRQQQTRASRRDSSRRRWYHSGSVIPKEYAEDVDFSEVRSYSEERAFLKGDGEIKYKQESQVSDAEVIEIKKDKS